ncbi:Rab3 GTPase-activating protein catalytic subunit-domain-containing protein [Cladochytrium replicatum]|nr:Rab3 GTPase-activating protein catalytic subunit-domain-containing protein [Cladochytrium replicatum]
MTRLLNGCVEAARKAESGNGGSGGGGVDPPSVIGRAVNSGAVLLGVGSAADSRRSAAGALLGGTAGVHDLIDPTDVEATLKTLFISRTLHAPPVRPAPAQASARFTHPASSSLAREFRQGSFGIPPRSFLWTLCIHLLDAASATSHLNYQNTQPHTFLKALWPELVRKIRVIWESGGEEYIPDVWIHGEGEAMGIDLRYNVLHQKLAMLNCCVWHRKMEEKRGGKVAKTTREREQEELDEVTEARGSSSRGAREGGENGDIFLDTLDDIMTTPSETTASAEVDEEREDGERDGDEEVDGEGGGEWEKVSEGQLRPMEGVCLLKTGQPLYIPKTQDIGYMTEDMIREQELIFERLGTSAEAARARARMQSAHLKSDMEAFKAANPGCCLEDFVRWHSPRDWVPDEEGAETEAAGENPVYVKGQLSARMREPGNLWEELWKSTRPVPVSRQKSLFDHSKEAEKVLRYLERTTAQEAYVMLVW